jgi:hypothetical protein
VIAKRSSNLRNIDGAEAHQLFNDVAAQAVMGVQCMPLCNGQRSSFDSTHPGPRLNDVLDEAFGCSADRCRTDTKECARPVGRVTLKIPPEVAGRGDDCQLVVGQGEMVEADAHITSSLQFKRRAFCLPQAFGCSGRLRGDQPLLLRHPRDMRIAEKRQPIRADRGTLIDGRHQRFSGLIGQSVNQVEVDVAPFRKQGFC